MLDNKISDKNLDDLRNEKPKKKLKTISELLNYNKNNNEGHLAKKNIFDDEKNCSSSVLKLKNALLMSKKINERKKQQTQMSMFEKKNDQIEGLILYKTLKYDKIFPDHKKSERILEFFRDLNKKYEENQKKVLMKSYKIRNARKKLIHDFEFNDNDDESDNAKEDLNSQNYLEFNFISSKLNTVNTN